MNKILNNRFKVKEELGKGSFGIVYKGIDMRSKKYVGIKVEAKAARFPQLCHEAKIVKLLSKATGFAKFYWYGEDTTHRYLVMSLLGPSVDTFLERAKKFSLTTVLNVSTQLLSRVQTMHK